MKPLTDAQRSALEAAKRRKGGILVSDERPLPNGCVTRYMAAKLGDCGWVTRINDTVLITKAGRRKLSEPIPEKPDVFLRNRDGLTTSRKDAVLTELILDAQTLAPFWHEQSERNKAAAKDKRDHARELRKSSRNWPTSGPCGPVVVRFEDDEAA